MNLFKTSLLSAIATILKIIIGFVANKILAIFVGPAGVAILGQFNSYSGMLTIFGNGGISSGVTKYIAEYGCDGQRQSAIVSTALTMAFYCSLLFGALNFTFASDLSVMLFGDIKYTIVLQAFSFSLVFTSLNTTVLSILNGYKRIKLYISIGVLNNTIGLVMTYILVIKYTIQGALISVILTQSVVFLITILFTKQFEWYKLSFLRTSFNKVVVKQLSQYTLMALTSACIIPVSHILIRKYLTEHFSLEETGYWQAVWKISEVYLMIITMSISTYYLPRLSEIAENKELKREIIRGYKYLLPITILLACSIYFMREFIILALYTSKFLPMKDLFLFQLIGDVLKIASWLFSFLTLAKAMTKVYITSEIVFGISFVVLTYLFISKFGLIGVTYAYALNYFIYLITMYIVIWKKALRV